MDRFEEFLSQLGIPQPPASVAGVGRDGTLLWRVDFSARTASWRARLNG